MPRSFSIIMEERKKMKIEPISAAQHRKNFQKMPFNKLYAIYKKKGSEYNPRTKRKLIELIMFWY